MTGAVATAGSALRSSLLLRVILLGVLILLLQIPIGLISGQMHARQQTREVARQEVTAMWGSSQTVIGPILSVPYMRRWSETSTAGELIGRQEVRTLRILPEQLEADGKLEMDALRRGIFEFPVYRGKLLLGGQFAVPDLTERGIEPDDLFWDQAELLLYVSDPRALEQPVQLSWNGQPVEFRPGAPPLGETNHPGIRAKLPATPTSQRFNFRVPLELKGSDSLRLGPVAKSTLVKLKSDWPHPSFKGGWAPDQREINRDGFTANWSVGYLGRSFPQLWQHGEDFSKAVCDSVFGVDLDTPVDAYRMSERSVKYALLFLGMTFVLIWLHETLGALRVHPVQYLLLGGALCLFYLLLLALSEHIGFGPAYLLGAALVTIQVTAYARAALKQKSRALLLGTVVAGLYVYLYVLLQQEDYALLFGSLGLFAVLTLIMYATRRVDWYALQARSLAGKPTAQLS